VVADQAGGSGDPKEWGRGHVHLCDVLAVLFCGGNPVAALFAGGGLVRCWLLPVPHVARLLVPDRDGDGDEGTDDCFLRRADLQGRRLRLGGRVVAQLAPRRPDRRSVRCPPGRGCMSDRIIWVVAVRWPSTRRMVRTLAR
jgi:hypothetical protein